MMGFRRICDKCMRPIDWTEATGAFHMDDKSPMCPNGLMAIEWKEFPDETLDDTTTESQSRAE